MDSADESVYRPVTRGMQIMLLAASVLVFLIDIPLVLLTTRTESYFAWTIGSALTAAFLGGAYWSSGVLELMASRETSWARARIAVPAVLLFTVLTLIATVIHLENFHFDAPAWHTVAGTWAWLTSIGVIAAHAVYENEWSRLRSFAASYAMLAVMQALALLRFGGEIDWTGASGWFYLLFLLGIGMVGLFGLLPKRAPQ